MSEKHPTHSQCRVMLSGPVLSHSIKRVSSYLIENLIVTPNRIFPSEKEREAKFNQKGKEIKGASKSNSKDG